MNGRIGNNSKFKPVNLVVSSKMAFNDDEQIVATPYDSGTKYETFTDEETKVTIIHKEKAPLENTKLTVFLELTGAGSVNERPGVDIVAVLDVGKSMEGEKLRNLKIASQFLIDKLSPADRLSIVSFSENSERLCPLRQMTRFSQSQIENLVNDLDVVQHPGKNISAGLETALQVINDRGFSRGRVAAIMLMSDGNQGQGANAATRVAFGKVPVYTFGFGNDLNPKVLSVITANSNGGVFSQTNVTSNLSTVFSPCLAKLLGVAVRDCDLTVENVNSNKGRVSAGRYPQSQTASDNSVTISFGDLYKMETRKVEVDVHLPAVSSQQSNVVLQIGYCYRTRGEVCKASLRSVTVTRTALPVWEGMSEVDDGQDGFVEAENELKQVEVDQSQGLLKALGSKLQQIPNVKLSSGGYRFPKYPFGAASRPSDSAEKQAESPAATISEEVVRKEEDITIDKVQEDEFAEAESELEPVEVDQSQGLLKGFGSKLQQIPNVKKISSGSYRFPKNPFGSTSRRSDTEDKQVDSTEETADNPVSETKPTAGIRNMMDSNIKKLTAGSEKYGLRFPFKASKEVGASIGHDQVPTINDEKHSSVKQGKLLDEDDQKALSWGFIRPPIEQATQIVVDKLGWFKRQSHKNPGNVELKTVGEPPSEDHINVKNQNLEDIWLDVLSYHLEQLFKSVKAFHNILLKSVISNKENAEEPSLEALSKHLEQAIQSVKAIQDMLGSLSKGQNVNKSNTDDQLKVSNDGLEQAFKSVKVIQDIVLNSVYSVEQGKSSEVKEEFADEQLFDILSDNLEQALKSVKTVQETLLAMPAVQF